MLTSDNLRSKLLLAQLVRATSLVDCQKNLSINYPNLKFNHTISRDAAGGVRLFSGVFDINRSTPVVPFTLAFYNSERTGLNQLALPPHHGSLRSSLLSLLSILDYLCDTRELKADFSQYATSLTAHGKFAGRAAIASEYESFKVRSIKDLPYDMSLDLLSDLAAA